MSGSKQNRVKTITVGGASDTLLGQHYNVILLNGQHHDQQQVTAQIQKATGFPSTKAAYISKEASITGRAVVYTSHREACEHVASVLEEIRLSVKIEPG